MVGRRSHVSVSAAVTTPSKRELVTGVREASTTDLQLLILPRVPADDAPPAVAETAPHVPSGLPPRPPETAREDDPILCTARPLDQLPLPLSDKAPVALQDLAPIPLAEPVPVPEQAPFPYLSLPLEIRELVMDRMSIPDLFNLQEALPEPSIAQRLSKRISAARPLFEAMASSNQKETPLPRQFTARSDLDLFLAELHELPASAIAEMRSLKSLDLRCNHLTSLPDSLRSCDRLKALYLVNNPVGPCLPDVVSRLASLELLWLSGIPVFDLPENMGDTMVALREVFVYGCPIRAIPGSLVRRLTCARQTIPEDKRVRLEMYNSALREEHRDEIIDQLTAARVYVIIAAS